MEIVREMVDLPLPERNEVLLLVCCFDLMASLFCLSICLRYSTSGVGVRERETDDEDLVLDRDEYSRRFSFVSCDFVYVLLNLLDSFFLRFEPS